LSSSDGFEAGSRVGEDRAPDAAQAPGTLAREIQGNVLGLSLAIGLTAASFWAAQTHLIYGPGIAMALLVLAVAQMGIHLIFFLHITTAPDNTNTVLALAFGVLIVCVLVFGSLWVMSHLNQAMMPANELMKMQP